DLLGDRQADTDVRALLDRRRRARCRRCGTRYPRHRPQVLYGGGQLGHRRQQHAGVLLPRSAAVPGPEPCDQARPAHRAAQRRQQLGFLDAAARGVARNMHLFGSHTFSMINAANERVWVKFHFRTQQGIQNLTDEEAAALIAKDRESHGRDLFNAIEAGDFPRWTLFIQVMTEAQAKTHRHNPFDLTKVWPKAEYPLIEVGVMELNRWPDNYFAEVEQAAFGPSNVVPGISFSPDRMLQARLFSYNDTVRYRLGVNFYQIPINAPKCPVMSYHRDGKMRVDGNLGGTTSFNPNSAGLWDNQPDFAEPPLPIEGEAAHYDHYADDDHWEQPGNLFRLMTPAQQQALFENTARAMGDARLHVKERHIANCAKADPAYGGGVARALGIESS